jgi:trimeric autotransporter adhesin
MKFMKRVVCVAVIAAGATHAGAQIEFYDFPLGGDQEVPPVPTAAFGFASLEYDPGTMLFDLVLGVDGIALGQIMSAHIHAGPRGSNGPVVIDLLALGSFVDAKDGLSILLLDDVSIGGMVGEDQLRSAGLYVNVHSTAFPDGEIRGQIVPGPSAGVLVAAGVMCFARRRRG